MLTLPMSPHDAAFDRSSEEGPICSWCHEEITEPTGIWLEENNSQIPVCSICAGWRAHRAHNLVFDATDQGVVSIQQTPRGQIKTVQTGISRTRFHSDAFFLDAVWGETSYKLRLRQTRDALNKLDDLTVLNQIATLLKV